MSRRADSGVASVQMPHLARYARPSPNLKWVPDSFSPLAWCRTSFFARSPSIRLVHRWPSRFQTTPFRNFRRCVPEKSPFHTYCGAQSYTGRLLFPRPVPMNRGNIHWENVVLAFLDNSYKISIIFLMFFGELSSSLF